MWGSLADAVVVLLEGAASRNLRDSPGAAALLQDALHVRHYPSVPSFNDAAVRLLSPNV